MTYNAELFEKAIIFAVNAHRGQKRKGNGMPYILHPMSVLRILYNVKVSKNLYLLGIASLLHDVKEDCGITLEEIAREFGYIVAALVEELSTNKEECERLGKAVYLSAKLLGMSSYALCIKLADRLDNVSDMKDMGQEFISRTTTETKIILYALQGRKLSKTHKTLIKLILKQLKKYN
jgi:(p)ppGpp synthase/HD superfamily hydrolase